jgi:hypothetical protein
MTTYTISKTANILAMHTVVHKARPDKYFRVSVVLWLFRRQPILRDYTVLKTAGMKLEDLGIFEAKVHAAQASGLSLPAARNSAHRSAATKKGNAKKGPARRSAASAKGHAKRDPEAKQRAKQNGRTLYCCGRGTIKKTRQRGGRNVQGMGYL